MRHIVIGTAGHIDHGKTALVRALTGIDADRLKEEKVRGITIDLGFAHDVRQDVTLAFVDVPGHERFVKNMLAGASGIDLVLLVVAANESVMPQTREHFAICSLLGVSRGVIAVTKVDLVDAETVELVKLEIRELVAGSTLDGAPVIAVSSTSGEGIETLREALMSAARGTPARNADGPFRLPVDRVFSVKGFGTVVTGTVVSGRLAPDATCELLPGGRRVKVRGLQGHGAALADIAAGQRAAVNVAGVDVPDVARGDCLVEPRCFIAARQVDAAVTILESARPLKHGTRVRFHHGTKEALGRIAIARSRRPAGGATPDAAMEVIGSGASAYVRVRLEVPVVLTRGDRFVLRSYSPPMTIGGGVIIDPLPPKNALRSPSSLKRFAALDPGDAGTGAAPEAADVVMTLVEEAGSAGVPVEQLTTRLALSSARVAAVVERLTTEGAVEKVGVALVGSSTVRKLTDLVVEAVRQYSGAHPLSDGLPREELRERLFAGAAEGLFATVVDALAGAGRIVGSDRLTVPGRSMDEAPGHDPTIRVARLLQDSGLRPPDTTQLAKELDMAPSDVEVALAVLNRQKKVLRIAGLWFATEALSRLKEDVRSSRAAGQTEIDVAAFKERYDITRKFAIPLLEYLDRERVTRRVGDVRVVL